MSNNSKDKGPNRHNGNNQKNGNNKSNSHGNNNNNNNRSGGRKPSIFEQGLPLNAIPGLKILDFNGRPDPIGLEEARRSLYVHVGREMTSFEAEIFDVNGKLHVFNEPVAQNYDNLSKVEKHRFEKNLEEFDKEVRIFERNMRKVYMIIWGQCSRSLQQAITEDADYEDVNRDKDGAKLWDIIKKLLQSGSRDPAAVNKEAQIVKAEQKFASVKQGIDESVSAFYDRYIIQLEALKIAGVKERTEANKAVDFINRLDGNRFMDLKAELENQMLFGKDLYPKTIIAAKTLAESIKRVNHVYRGGHSTSQVAYVATSYSKKGKKNSADGNNNRNGGGQQSSNGNNNNNPSNSGKKKKDLSNIECYNCHKKGHYQNNCPERKSMIDAKEELENEEYANVAFNIFEDESIYFLVKWSKAFWKK